MANKTGRLKIIIGIGVLLLIIAGLFVSFLKWEREPKPDPASEKIIRRAAAEILFSQTLIRIDPNSLTDADFAKVTEFEITNKELSDIRLLAKFRNLHNLRLVGIHYPPNKIPKWMKILSKYGIFNLEERFRIDLSPLANLTNLRDLYLNMTKVSDIKPLANLTNLRVLIISKTDVSDITPLANLPNLNWLEMTDTQVSDISALANLPSLQAIDIWNTKVRDISALASLPNLDRIWLDVSKVGDEQIAELKKALPNLLINPY